MKREFGVNLRQIVHLLAHQLYSNPEVVVRELIQNSYDAIRSRYGSKSATRGRIQIQCDQVSRTLSFSDNGSGMNEMELVEYLSTLGDGIKARHDLLAQKGVEFIGEYGIGFFSAFIIADRIEIHTRKEEESGYIWRSSGVDGYEVEKSQDAKLAVGTTVILYLQQSSAADFTNRENVRRIATEHCEFLDCPIYLNQLEDPINEERFAWEIKDPSGQKAWFHKHIRHDHRYRTCGRSLAGKIPFQYAFCCGETHERRIVRIYTKRMFVSGDYQLVPSSLPFVDAIISCDSLKLGLSREGVQSDPTFRQITEKIEELLLEWVTELIRKNRKDEWLVKMLHDSQTVFQSTALQSGPFLNKVFKHWLFSLYGDSKRYILLEDYISQQNVVKGVVLCTVPDDSKEDRATEKERFVLYACQQRGIPVIHVHDADDDELLRRICIKFGVQRRRISQVADAILQLAAPSDAAIEKVRRHIELYFNRRVRIVDLSASPAPIAFAGEDVLLNNSNELLLRLGRTDAQPELLKPIYSSLLRTFETISRAKIDGPSLERLASALTTTLQNWLESAERSDADRRKLSLLTDRWWNSPPALANASRSSLERNGRRYRARCFLAYPFSEAYRDVSSSVMRVCEELEILAESAEQPDSIDILVKICRYIDACDFAIVDISENNPNVLFELGIIIARRKPAIIICNSDRRALKGVAIPVDIIGIERIEYMNTSVDLPQKLKLVLRKIVEA